MLVFIDDSGDPGFKPEKGSTSHFVVACVIFDDPLDAEETSLRVKRFRQSLGWAQHREFKFSKTSAQIREQFFEALRECRFRVRAIVVVDKSLIRSDELRNDRHSFYNFFIKELLRNSGERIHDAKVRLDGHGDRTYKRAALTYFRQQLNARGNHVIENLKFVDSSSDSLIQLADMVAGAILRSQGTKPDRAVYHQLLSARIEDVWEFR